MEVDNMIAESTYNLLKKIEDNGISLGGLVQDWEEIISHNADTTEDKKDE